MLRISVGIRICSAPAIDCVDEPVCIIAGRFGDFPAVFAFGFEPGQGPGLILSCCLRFHEMPMGTYLFAVFMLLVVFATLTSRVFHAGNRDRGNHPPRRESAAATLDNRYCDFHSRYSFGAVFRRIDDFKIFGKNHFLTCGISSFPPSLCRSVL